MEPIWSLGLMSGTSLDGVDVAWLQTDGNTIQKMGEGIMVPYPPHLREKIRSILGQNIMTLEVRSIERELTLFQAKVVKEAQKIQSFDVIGFHGQTIFHAPSVTRQLGDGALLAKEVGVDVIYDFRSQDMIEGGQGAPLVPIFHRALIETGAPIAIVNVGGVANMTWMQKDWPLIACDTGPGGALLDDWTLKTTGKPYDENGLLSSQGVVNEACIQEWLAHNYFAKSYPKSLDRNDFEYLLKDIEALSPADGAATLVELTARSIIHALTQMPTYPQKLYITGGGRRNLHLIQRLRVLASCAIESVEDLGWNGDLLEAFAFAYLAVRVKVGLPTSFPTTTGVKQPLSGGQLAKGLRKTGEE